MPEQIHCPECNAVLRVPESLLGKNVKCPKCQTNFLAEMEESAPQEATVREPPPSSIRPRPRLREDQEDEEPLPEEDFEEEERPRRRRRRRFADAEPLVSGPATGLLVVGIIDIVLGIGTAFGVSLLMWAAPKQPGENTQDLVMASVFYVIVGIAEIIIGSLITMGAARMKRLSSYGFAMTACILAMIPFANCCLIGLPFGIWALTVLNKPEVKDAFR